MTKMGNYMRTRLNQNWHWHRPKTYLVALMLELLQNTKVYFNKWPSLIKPFKTPQFVPSQLCSGLLHSCWQHPLYQWSSGDSYLSFFLFSKLNLKILNDFNLSILFNVIIFFKLMTNDFIKWQTSKSKTCSGWNSCLYVPVRTWNFGQK